MKRSIFCYFSFILITLISLQSVIAENPMNEISLEIELGKNVDVQAKYVFMDEIDQVSFPCECDFKDIKIEDGICEKIKTIDNILVCRPPSPYMVGQLEINPSFKITDVIKTNGNVSYFSLDIPILWDTDEVNIEISLPEGIGLVEDDNFPLSPKEAIFGSDGRRITIIYNEENLEKGDVIPLRVAYNSVSNGDFISEINSSLIVVVVLLAIVIIVLLNKFLARRSQIVLSVLNENERAIIDLIKKQPMDKIDQRKIVSVTGFSKAKVSRIIQDLEERRMVERKKIGRKNMVYLKSAKLKEL